MKTKTSELAGRALAYAVGVAEEYQVETWRIGPINIVTGGIPRSVPWNPHSDWAQGGPIIEREKIGIGHSWGGDYWLASAHDIDADIWYGPTPLIAAMRCFVASKLGDEVDIPDALL